MYWRALLLLILGWFVTASSTADASVQVVATIFTLADMVEQIGGTEVEVATLLPPGANPHTFEPNPSQVRALARAQVLVEVGAGLDGWITKLRPAGSERLLTVTITAGVPLLSGSEVQESGGGDPHVWLDPLLVRDHIVPAIAAALIQADAAHRAAYEAAAVRYQSALTQLDADLRAAFAPLPQHTFITFHSAWTYFARRYGLEEAGVVERFPGKEPSAQEIAALVQKARAAQVRALLIEPQFGSRLAQQIATEFGGHVVTVDPLGGPGIAGRNHYLDLMRYNLAMFVKALQ